MKAIAAASLIAMVVLTGVAESIAAPPPPKPGWTVLVCSIFSTASSVAITAAPADQSPVAIGEWTRENKATNWVLPGAMAEVDKISVHLKAAPPDKTAKVCLLYQKVPRKLFDFTGEASATASKTDAYTHCPCSRGRSLDEP